MIPNRFILNAELKRLSGMDYDDIEKLFEPVDPLQDDYNNETTVHLIIQMVFGWALLLYLISEVL